MTQNLTTTTYATINIDALLLAGIYEPALSRNFISKLSWMEMEQNQLNAHLNGAPSFRLSELEDVEKYVREAENAAKKALFDLNKAYKERTGRYIVLGMIKDRANLCQIFNEILAM